MAEDSRQSLDRKTREVLKSDVPKGKEYATLQSAQQQLLAIQAEQRQNLNVARAESKSDAGNRNALMQAGGAAAAAVAAVEANNLSAPATVNPQTQAILGKYGLGQPRIQKTQSRNQQVTKQNIVINNNTTNTTHNNVAVPTGGGGPVQGRALSFKPQDPKTSSMSQFKNWMSQAFAKQEEEGKKRDAEYKRREWSLTRSANKMMRKLEEIGRTVGERMDPRRIGSTWTSQLKTLLFLFGFGLLATNWSKILLFVSKIEENIKKFLRYMGVLDRGNGQSGFVKDLKYFLGGDPNNNKSLLDTFSQLFLGDGKNGNKLGLFGYLKIYFDDLAKDRQEAFKRLKFPDLSNAAGLGDILKSLGIYIGDAISILVSGSSALESHLKNDLANSSSHQALGGFGGAQKGYRFSQESDALDKKGNKIDDTSWWDASMEAGGKKSRANVLDVTDFESNDPTGELRNNTRSTILQGRALTTMINEADSNKVHTGAVLNGFQKLESRIRKDGDILVDKDFIEGLESLGISRDMFTKGKGKALMKFVRVKKTEDDYAREHAGGFWKGAGEGYIRRAGLNAAEEALLGSEASSLGTWAADAAVSGDLWQNSTWQGAKEGIYQWAKRVGADDYKLELVPASDPREGVQIPIGGGKYQRLFEYWRMGPGVLAKIKKVIAEKTGNSNFSFDAGDAESIASLDSVLRDIKKQKVEERYNSLKGQKRTTTITTVSPTAGAWHSNNEEDAQKHYDRNVRSKGIESDYDKKSYNAAKELNETRRKREEERDEIWKNSAPGLAVERTIDAAGNVISSISEKAGQFIAGGGKIIAASNEAPVLDYRNSSAKGVGAKNNNPSNRTGKDGVFGSGIRKDGNHTWTVYKNMTDGYAGNALLKLEYLDGTMKSVNGGKRNPTVADIVYTWAPPSDGNNSAAYTESVAKMTGLGTNTPIPITKENLLKLTLATGKLDSGYVNVEEAKKGVDMAWEHWTKNKGIADDEAKAAGLQAMTITGATSGNANMAKVIEASMSGTYKNAVGTGREVMEKGGRAECTAGPSSFYEAAGINLRGHWWTDPKTATKARLDEVGFTIIWHGSGVATKKTSDLVNAMAKNGVSLKPGDISTQFGYHKDGSPSSHGCLWNGQNWISDFNQGSTHYVYGKDRLGDNSVQIWRYDKNEFQEGNESTSQYGSSQYASEAESQPEGWIDMFKRKVREWVLSFGFGGNEQDGSMIEVDTINSFKGPQAPDYSYKGAITSEFTNYKSYLQNSGHLKDGMSFVEWSNEVKRQTGEMPADLVLDSGAEWKRRAKLQFDPNYNFAADSPEYTNYTSYLEKSGNLSFEKWQDMVKKNTGKYPAEILVDKTGQVPSTEDILGNGGVNEETRAKLSKYLNPADGKAKTPILKGLLPPTPDRDDIEWDDNKGLINLPEDIKKLNLEKAWDKIPYDDEKEKLDAFNKQISAHYNVDLASKSQKELDAWFRENNFDINTKKIIKPSDDVTTHTFLPSETLNSRIYTWDSENNTIAGLPENLEDFNFEQAWYRLPRNLEPEVRKAYLNKIIGEKYGVDVNKMPKNKASDFYKEHGFDIDEKIRFENGDALTVMGIKKHVMIGTPEEERSKYRWDTQARQYISKSEKEFNPGEIYSRLTGSERDKRKALNRFLKTRYGIDTSKMKKKDLKEFYREHGFDYSSGEQIFDPELLGALPEDINDFNFKNIWDEMEGSNQQKRAALETILREKYNLEMTAKELEDTYGFNIKNGKVITKKKKPEDTKGAELAEEALEIQKEILEANKTQTEAIESNTKVTEEAVVKAAEEIAPDKEVTGSEETISEVTATDAASMGGTIQGLFDITKFNEGKKSAEEKQQETLEIIALTLQKMAGDQKLGNDLTKKLAEISAHNVDATQNVISSIMATASKGGARPNSYQLVEDVT